MPPATGIQTVIPEHLKKSLEQLGAVVHHPGSGTNSIIHIPGSDTEWLFEPGPNSRDEAGIRVHSRKAGSGGFWNEEQRHWQSVDNPRHNTAAGTRNLLREMGDGDLQHTGPNHNLELHQRVQFYPDHDTDPYGPEPVGKTSLLRQGVLAHHLNDGYDPVNDIWVGGHYEQNPTTQVLIHSIFNSRPDTQTKIYALLDHLMDKHGLELPLSDSDHLNYARALDEQYRQELQ